MQNDGMAVVWMGLIVATALGISGQDGDKYDISGHKSSFVTVAPGVQLEVLEWGGDGPPLVLLGGLGDNAHVFDDFAYQFTDKFHVIAITRRGYGKSSKPEGGYDLDTRVRDNIAVLDKLNVRDATFIGHSIAATELYKLAADYPTRVKKLVNIDGGDLSWGGWSSLPQPPGPPDLDDSDVVSVHRYAASDVRDSGNRKPLAAISNGVKTDASGKVIAPDAAPDTGEKIYKGLQPAKLERIKAPFLAIFNKMSPQYRLPYFWSLDPAQQKVFVPRLQALINWIDSSIQHFRTSVKQAKIVEIKDANHYLFLTNEAQVVREIRKFLLEK